MSSPAPSPLQTLTPDDLAILRVVARLTTRVRKNAPRILGTLRRQLEQDPDADKLRADIEWETRQEPSGALRFRVHLRWKTTRLFEDKDEDGELFVPGQLELFPAPGPDDQAPPPATEPKRRRRAKVSE
jgi:hypothetical protein